jgi:hypothetical protein
MHEPGQGAKFAFRSHYLNETLVPGGTVNRLQANVGLLMLLRDPEKVSVAAPFDTPASVNRILREDL